MIKDGDRNLVTVRVAVLKIWEGYFEELLKQGGTNGELGPPCYVDGEV